MVSSSNQYPQVSLSYSLNLSVIWVIGAEVRTEMLPRQVSTSIAKVHNHFSQAILSIILRLVLRFVVGVCVRVIAVTKPAANIGITHFAVVKLVAGRHCGGVEEGLCDSVNLGVGEIGFLGWSWGQILLAQYDVNVEMAVVASFVVSAGFSECVSGIDVAMPEELVNGVIMLAVDCIP
jgi:hypothetical protein